MRKILCFIAIALVGVVAFAQTITLTFTGRDAADHYVQLNRVSITNLTKGWQETIYWPDTTLTMQNGTGIDESVANGGFVLSQNTPNPFTGTTDVNLAVVDAGARDIGNCGWERQNRRDAPWHVSTTGYKSIPRIPVHRRHIRIDRSPKRQNIVHQNGMQRGGERQSD